MNLVIDASILIKFYIPEILADESAKIMSRVSSGELTLCAPDLLYPETGNILWKKRRRNELTPEEVDEIVDVITALPIMIAPSLPVLPLAVTVALRSGVTVYDAMYVAVARLYDIKMITADKRLVDAVARTEFGRFVRWLGAGL